MPFYPYKDFLMWQEVESQQRSNYSKKLNELIYREVRNTYLGQFKDEVKKYLQRNAHVEMGQIDESMNPTQILTHIYGDGVSTAQIEQLMSKLGISDRSSKHEKYQKRPNITKADSIQTGQERQLELEAERVRYLQLAEKFTRDFSDNITLAKGGVNESLIRSRGSVQQQSSRIDSLVN